jgi:hypothetical protein
VTVRPVLEEMLGPAEHHKPFQSDSFSRRFVPR